MKPAPALSLAVCSLALSAVSATAFGQRAPVAPTAPSCTLRSARSRLERVTVHSENGPDLVLAVQGAGSELELTVGSPEGRVRVATPLRFQGTVSTSELLLQPARAVDDATGMAHLSPPEALHNPRWDGRAVRTTAQLFGEGTLELALPCDALGTEEAPALAGEVPTLSPDAPTARLAVRSPLVLFARPAPGAPSLSLSLAQPAAVPLEQLATRGAFTQVRLRWGAGSVLEGWARTSSVRRTRPSDGVLGAVGHGSGTGSGEGYARAGRYYRGPATVTPGTQVFASPGHGAWATLTGNANTRVLYVHGQPFVAIEQLDGLGGLANHAWVLRSAVQFPPEAGVAP